jgi:hypothetical protein
MGNVIAGTGEAAAAATPLYDQMGNVLGTATTAADGMSGAMDTQAVTTSHAMASIGTAVNALAGASSDSAGLIAEHTRSIRGSLIDVGNAIAGLANRAAGAAAVANGAANQAVHSSGIAARSSASAANWSRDALRAAKTASGHARDAANQSNYAAGAVRDALRNSPGIIRGSFASGLDRVPYDGFVGQMHEGETILNEQTADLLRKFVASPSTGNVVGDDSKMIDRLERIHRELIKSREDQQQDMETLAQLQSATLNSSDQQTQILSQVERGNDRLARRLVSNG